MASAGCCCLQGLLTAGLFFFVPANSELCLACCLLLAHFVFPLFLSSCSYVTLIKRSSSAASRATDDGGRDTGARAGANNVAINEPAVAIFPQILANPEMYVHGQYSRTNPAA